MQYISVPVSQTDLALGGNLSGAKGDFIQRIIITSDTATAANCSIKDGAGSAIPLTTATTPIGAYTLELEIYSSTGAWSITTGANATAIVVGNFS